LPRVHFHINSFVHRFIRFGIGDLGKAEFDFIDFLAQAKQTLWQVLPLGQTGYSDSPYQCFSAFAGNIYLISLEKLVESGRNVEYCGFPMLDLKIKNYWKR